MKCTRVLVVSAVFASRASGFTGVHVRRTFSRRDVIGAHHRLQIQGSGDYLGEGTTIKCSCCTRLKYGVSCRTARIEVPIAALFASGAFVRPALANDEEVASPAFVEPKEEMQQTDLLVSESTLTEGEPKSSPPPQPTQKTFDDALRQYFPKALLTSVVATKVQNALSQRKFTQTNTLMGCSLCPDEINSKPGNSLLALLQDAMTAGNSGVFQLGGLAGLPYMGVSGMKAFLSHAPLNGKVFILYGPHVGITEAGYVGRVERQGQAESTLDCDTTLHALMTALKERKRDRLGGGSPVTTGAQKIAAPDKREECMVAKLRTALDSNDAVGLTKNDLPAFATFQMFDLVKEQIHKQLQACLKDDGSGTSTVRWDGNINEIVLLGGIIINRGRSLAESIDPREDYFQPLVFESYSNSGTLADVKDLYLPVFGAKPIPFYAS